MARMQRTVWTGCRNSPRGARHLTAGFCGEAILGSSTLKKRPRSGNRKSGRGTPHELPPQTVPRRRRRLVTTWALAAGLVLVVVVWAAWPQWLKPHHSAPTQPYQVLRTYPHDPGAYCQGLVYHDGFLYEGTGSYGRSSLRKVELETGRVVKKRELDAHLFGEGITLWKDRIIQLTWKSKQAIEYRYDTFEERRRFPYRGEGWGLTHDGRQLIMSDGTATLRFLDPQTFAVKRRLLVKDGSRRVSRLNELEYVGGEIYANIWYDDHIVRISPRTGRVLAWIDLSRLYPAARRRDSDNVLNGIAYDSQHNRLFVTGKNWPTLFEIRLLK